MAHLRPSGDGSTGAARADAPAGPTSKRLEVLDQVVLFRIGERKLQKPGILVLISTKAVSGLDNFRCLADSGLFSHKFRKVFQCYGCCP
jgi:hypothetical protein